MDIMLRGLAKCFDHDDVLTGVDLDLGPGQTVAVIELNGAGKTTLLRCLAGIHAEPGQHRLRAVAHPVCWAPPAAASGLPSEG